MTPIRYPSYTWSPEMEESQILDFHNTPKRSIPDFHEKRNMGGACSTKTTANSSCEDGVLVPFSVPEDPNVGEHRSVKSAITSFFGWSKKPSTEKLFLKELSKLTDVRDCVEACERYKKGVSSGMSGEQLLEMIREIQARRA